MPHSTKKTIVVVLIQVAIALIHVFRLGQLFNGQAYNLYYSYFSDFILPFGFYFLLTLNEATIPAMRHWYVKAGIIFLLCASAELCQLFGIYVLGVTFDLVDILMYGIGVLAAAFIDVKIFSTHLGFWQMKHSG